MTSALRAFTTPVLATRSFLRNLLIAAAALLLWHDDARATHAMGGELTYQSLGGNLFKVTLKFYRDCNGVEAPTNCNNGLTFNVKSTACGANFDQCLALESVQVITPICAGEIDRCNSANGTYGVEEYTFSKVINLSTWAGCGTDWVISWALCCRNNAITSLNQPGSRSLYLNSLLNNVVTPRNNSAVFLNSPTPYYCLGQTISYNPGAFDPDGDSLAFSIIQPRTVNNANIPFNAGYTVSQPIHNTGGANAVAINPLTGTITCVPDIQQVAVVTYRVTEFRNGVQVGAVTRDVQFVVRQCAGNTSPTAQGINGTSNYSTNVCVGQPISFTVPTTDPNAGQSTTLSWNNGIPGATFTVAGAPFQTGTFTWTPTLADIGLHTFSVTVNDNACPLVGTGDFGFSVNVTPPFAAANAGPDLEACGSITLQAVLPFPSTPHNWTIIQGAGNFSDQGPNAFVTGLAPGTNIFQWNLNYAPCGSTSDQVTVINFNSGQQAPNAGPDQELCAPITTTNLAGNVATAPAVGTWSLVSGSGSIVSPNSPTSQVTNLGPGQNRFRWSIDNGPCIGVTFDDVFITVYPVLGNANAGPDLSLCTPNNNAAMNASAANFPANGLWSIVSGGGAFFNLNSPNTLVGGIPVGVNTYRWTVNNGPCGTTNDLITVTVFDQNSPAANAGPDQNVCAITATLAGNTPTFPATGTWTLVSGSGTITAPNSPTSGVTGLGVGANVFQWTSNNGACANGITTDQVRITRFDPAAPVANAGPDQSVCSSSPATTLAGNTPSSPSTGLWTLVSGSGTITTPASPTTTVTGLGIGVVTLRWTISNGPCGAPTSDLVSITVYDQNAVVANAGPDQSKCLPVNTATLAGNTPTVPSTGVWTLVSGAGTIITPGSPTSGITGLGVGSNVFRWTINNGACANPLTTDDVVITVFNNGTAAAAAGPDQNICSTTSTITLTGSTIAAPATGLWTLVSGTGAIATSTQSTTTATGLSIGQNTFQWTVNNGSCGSSNDQVSVFVFDVNNPVANAGPDQSFCTPTTTATMAGSAITFPATGTWTRTVGTGTIVTPSSRTTQITGLSVGVNTFRWTVNNGPCGGTTTDDVTIFIYDQNAPVANAGPDQNICSTTTTALMSGSPLIGVATGQWSLVSGSGTITASNSPFTSITGLAVGVNTFQWTVNNGPCGTTTDQVRIFVFNASDPVADAGPDINQCTPFTTASMAGSSVTFPGTGTWTLVSGTGTITAPGSSTTSITGLGVGTNVFRWTVNNGPCGAPTSDLVSITIFDQNAQPANAGPDQSICSTTPSVALAANTPVGSATGSWTITAGTATITNPVSPSTTLTNLGVGTVTAQWSINNGTCGTSTDAVTILVYNANNPVANAGPDQSFCTPTSSTTLSGSTLIAPATGSWTLVSGSGTVTNPNSPTSGVTGLAVGTNVFRWTVNNGPCGAPTNDLVSILIYDAGNPLANAGPDQVHCRPDTVATMAGSTLIAPATGTWTLESGTGGTITNPNSPATTITGLAVGVHIFRWTVNNGPCGPATFDLVSISVFDDRQEVASAGADQSICVPTFPNSVTLNASGATFPATGTWTLVSGSGTIVSPNSSTTQVNGLNVGINTFQWTINNGPCANPITSDQVSIFVFDAANPIANAGPDQNLCTPITTTVMAGSDLISPATGTWTLLSGTGTIVSPTSPTTQITGLGLGINTFRWTVSNGPCLPGITNDVVTINVFNGAAQVATAGEDQDVCSSQSTVTLNGNVPSGLGQGTWTVQQGSATFANLHLASTTATGLSIGVNVFVWSIDNGACGISSDLVTINYYDTNQGAANAGPDQNLCVNGGTAQTTLSGSAIVIPGQGTWTVLNGTGTFVDNHDPGTLVSGLSIGINTFRWTVVNGPCVPPVTSDVVAISVYDANAPLANAGSDQQLCTPNTSTSLAGNDPVFPATGAWTVVQGTGIFSDPSDASTGVTGLSVGENIFRWTINNGACSNPISNDVVSVFLFDQNNPIANAGPNAELCTPASNYTMQGSALTFPATGNWTLISGAGTISNATDPLTSITDLQVGANVFEWTVSNGPCNNPITTSQMTITVFDASNPIANAGGDQSLCGAFNTTLQGSSLIAPATGLWQVVSGTATFADATDPNTGVSGLSIGAAVLSWTVSNGPCANGNTNDQVTINVFDGNAPQADAGSDQELCSDNSNATLQGNAPIGVATGSWSVVQGSATFLNAANPATTVSGLGVGENILQWTIDNGVCGFSNDQVSLFVFDANNPSAAAGGDQNLCTPNTTAAMFGSALTFPATGTWALVSGAGTITDPTDPNTTITDLGIGANVFSWTVSNGPCANGNTVDQVTINLFDQNAAPANAGADQELCTPTGSTTLAANAPVGVGVGTWTIVQGTGTFANANDPNSVITGLTVGETICAWTIDNGPCGSSSDQVSLFLFDANNPVAAAGPDQEVCTPTTSAVLAGSNVIFPAQGTWSLVQGSGTFANVNDPNTTVSGLSVGESIFQWTVDNGPCANGITQDQVTILLFDSNNGSADAGPDQELCTPLSSTALAGSSVTFPATGTWSLVQGAGVLANVNDPNSAVTGLTVGENIFVWTVSNGTCANGLTVDSVSVFLFDENNPVANAGADQELCTPTTSTTLSGSHVTFPAAGTWTLIQGTGTFADANDPNSAVNGLSVGENIFQWTVSNGPCANPLTTDLVSIFVFDANNPVANAGPDQSQCTPNVSTSLEGSTVIFPAQGTWTLVAGSGVLTDATSPVSGVTGLAVGANTFVWTVDNGPCTNAITTDSVTIFIYDQNNAGANAGVDQQLCTPTTATNLAGSTVTFPAVGTWTLISGTGNITDPNDPLTEVSGLSIGENIFEWSVSNGPCDNGTPTTDQVSIFVFDENNPVADAGADQELCTPSSSATLTGSAVTFPATGTWTLINGNGTFVNAGDPSTAVGGLTVGENIFVWTVSNGPCANALTTDTVSVFLFDANNPSANAGPDQSLCGPNDTAQLAGSSVIFPAQGTWSILQGTGTFSDANDPNAVVSGLSVGETIIRWTVDNGPCENGISTDQLSIFLYDDQNPVADAGADQQICTPTSTTTMAGSAVTFPATGLWTVVTGTATIANPADPNTTVSDLVVGETVLLWTVDNGPCVNPVTTDLVSIFVFDENNPVADAGNDQDICTPVTFTALAGSAVTFPAIGTWTLISGQATFTDPNDPTTSVTDLGVGVNVIEWSVNNGPCANGTMTDQLNITLFDLNAPPAAAGPDQEQCTPNTSTTMAGNDPTPPGTGVWSVAQGTGTFADATSPTTAVTDLTVGENILVWTLVNGVCGTSHDSVSVFIFDEFNPAANAGNDVEICVPQDSLFLAGNTPTFPAIGTWSVIDGAATFADVNDPGSKVVGLAIGANTFVWTVDNGPCANAITTDTMTVILYSDSTAPANAGPDLETCLPLTFVSLQAETPQPPAVGTWTLLSGTGNIVDPNDPQSLVNGLTVGISTFVWNLDLSPCANSGILADTMQVYIYDPSAPPADAGPDQELCTPDTITNLQGNVPSFPGEGTWTLIAGTGDVADIHDANSAVTGLTVGINTFVWLIYNGQCGFGPPSVDTVNITVFDSTAPLANAGPDQDLCTPNISTTLAGSSIIFPGTGQWVLINGTATITDASNPLSTVTDLAVGENVFTWTNDNGACGTSIDTVMIRVFDSSQEVASAGPDQEICIPTSPNAVTMAANAPIFPATGEWVLVSGTATIADASDPATAITDLTVGVVNLQWTITNGPCGQPTTDEVTITIYDAASPDANAGADQQLCSPASSASLTGNSPIFPATGNWTITTGTGVLDDATLPTATISGLTAGVTTLVWTLDNGPCANGITTDTMTVTIYDSQTPEANAGEDQPFCTPLPQLIQLGATAVNLPAVGSWAVISGNATLVNAGDPASAVSDLGLGENVFEWTINNGVCGTSSDLVSINVWDGTAPPANGGPDQSFCKDTTETEMHALPALSTSVGVWQLIAGSGNIIAPTDTNTMVNQLAPGVNILLWTVDNGACGTTADSVTITLDDCTELTIPDAFSPNEDGRNDTYVILGLEHYPENTLQVFNRWGSQVLNRSPYRNNWDGRSENNLNWGEELPESTYYYILDLGNGDEPYTGYIYLRR